jgi:hypothetical protein
MGLKARGRRQSAVHYFFNSPLAPKIPVNMNSFADPDPRSGSCFSLWYGSWLCFSILYGSGSDCLIRIWILTFQRGNLKKLLFIPYILTWFSLSSRSNKTQPEGIPTLLNFPFQLILCAHYSSLRIRIPTHLGTDPDPGNWYGSSRIRNTAIEFTKSILKLWVFRKPVLRNRSLNPWSCSKFWFRHWLRFWV